MHSSPAFAGDEGSQPLAHEATFRQQTRTERPERDVALQILSLQARTPLACASSRNGHCEDGNHTRNQGRLRYGTLMCEQSCKTYTQGLSLYVPQSPQRVPAWEPAARAQGLGVRGTWNQASSWEGPEEPVK